MRLIRFKYPSGRDVFDGCSPAYFEAGLIASFPVGYWIKKTSSGKKGGPGGMCASVTVDAHAQCVCD